MLTRVVLSRKRSPRPLEATALSAKGLSDVGSAPWNTTLLWFDTHSLEITVLAGPGAAGTQVRDILGTLDCTNPQH